MDAGEAAKESITIAPKRNPFLMLRYMPMNLAAIWRRTSSTPNTKQVVFVPQLGKNSSFTDPSYHLPHYYELWARWADKDNEFWAEAAKVSREYLKTAVHPQTGLAPNYS